MEKWKQHAHLFGNGKFKVKAGNSDDYITTFQPYINDSNGKYYHNGWAMHECTLIARPIEDMTDEEVQRSAFIKQLRDNPDISSWHDLDFKEAMYLLSIGVYPFDQSHFYDETVLNINEAEL